MLVLFAMRPIKILAGAVLLPFQVLWDHHWVVCDAYAKFQHLGQSFGQSTAGIVVRE